MIKNILKLNGAQELNKAEQKVISGGFGIGLGESRCPGSRECVIGVNPGGDIVCGPCHL
ncbi:hypothetical protein [uncultured Aquimarina sp.]|uniref:hypothetical protein n=1 Tax=uncultured Aquimarina sp. TaxID=575652 RepID=UPI00260B9272|nr:hypothetical protein [uncultured Aquimarina sp.]